MTEGGTTGGGTTAGWPAGPAGGAVTDPWAPAATAVPARPWHRPTLALSVAAGLLFAAGWTTVIARGVLGAVEDRRAVERAAADREAAAEAATDRALERPADTATVSPAPDGSRRFRSTPEEPHAHAYHLALPRGWEGRYVGARASEYDLTDAVLTRPGTPTAVVIDRIAPGLGAHSEEFADLLYERLTTGDPPVEITSAYTRTTVGEDDMAFRYDGTMRNGAQRIRVVVFEHGGETFRVDFVGPASEWRTLSREFERILRSWRWG